MYSIVRHYDNGRTRTIKTRLTLEEAQAHCSNPKTSSSTGGYSHYKGKWFDSYVKSKSERQTIIDVSTLDSTTTQHVRGEIYRALYNNLWYYYAPASNLDRAYLSLNTLKRRLI